MGYRISLRHAVPPGTRGLLPAAGRCAGSVWRGQPAGRNTGSAGALSTGLGTPAGSPRQPQHRNLCGAEIVRAHLHEQAGVEQQTMRQEAGNMSSGAISLSFDLDQEHAEEARCCTREGSRWRGG